MTDWTIEEECILHLYNRGSRLSTVSAIEEILPYLNDDPDMKRIVVSTLHKAEQAEDAEFLLALMETDPLWEETEEAV